ncbi:MAG: hypothetical protein LC725_03095 [Lentisphaerae bacterium]|nr:hypothetical protein [Lentisphaerota bacterium]
MNTKKKRRGCHGPDKTDLHQRLGCLFWDVDISTVDLSAHPEWLVERVLEYGDLDDVRLLIAYFGQDAFLDLVSSSRYSSRKTMCFWREILKQEGRSCTRKFSLATAWIR